MLFKVILGFFPLHKERRTNPLILTLRLHVTVTVEMTTQRLRLMAVVWVAGRDGDMRQERSTGRWV